MSYSAQEGASFQGTRWSVVMSARDKGSPAGSKALSELCRLYWYPLYAFVRRSGYGHHEAEDLTQGFFQHLLSKDGLGNVGPEKGRFRSFLLVSLKHFLANERDRAGAEKRGGDVIFVPIDMTDGGDRYTWEAADSLTSDVLYERSWASALLAGVLGDLRAEYEGRGRGDVFAALERFISGETPADSYADVARLLHTTEGNVKVMAHRIRRRFGELLRERVAHTVESESEIDQEIRGLISCFAE